MSTPNAGGLVAGDWGDGETPVNAGLVDVLLATFNGAKYLVAQLESILSQTHQNFRILVSDDGSLDATMEILHQYRARLGERLILVPNPGEGEKWLAVHSHMSLAKGVPPDSHAKRAIKAK